jgi:hypothetical protein
MAVPFLTPALAGSILAAVVVGVHLGESSVNLIHPVHFKGPAVHPRLRGAAIEEPGPVAREPVYSDLYGWEEGLRMRAADCGDCDALDARDTYAYSAAIPYFGRGGPLEEPEPIRIAAYEPGPGSPRSELVDRYSTYPVDASEADAADADKDEVPAEFFDE